MTPIDTVARPPRALPLVTVALVAASVAVFCIQRLMGYSFPSHLEAIWRALPPDAAFLTPQFWVLVVPATLAHNGWPHLSLNLIGLAFFAQDTEAKFGHRFVLALAIGAMVGGTGLELAISGVAKIGMSGVVFAFFGVFLVGPRTVSRRLWLILVLCLLSWLISGLIFGSAASGVGNVAHTAGLIMGIAASILLRIGYPTIAMR